MPFLETIVDELNDSLKSSLNINIKAYGIAETMVKATDDQPPKIMRYPAVVDNDGEATMIEVDDVYPVTIYHRIESIANGLAPTKQQFGRTPELTEVVNMSMVVISFRDRIRKNAYWLENIIKDKLPDKISGASIRVGTSNFDKLSLLAREFTEVDLAYQQLIFFETKYQITTIYKKGCIDQCKC